MAPRKKIDRNEKKRIAFLAALEAGASVADAANAARIGVRTAYNWRAADKTFASDWERAYAQGADALHAEALRRATEGIDEPVYHQGKVVGYVRRRSDTLLMFLMKARDPERYCDRVRAAKITRRWAKDDAGASAPTDEAELATLCDLLDAIAAEKRASGL